MLKSLSINRLIWIDCYAAFVAGLFLLILKSKLAPFFNLPESLLTNMMLVAFVFSCFSFYLANQNPKPNILLKTLVLGNAMYAILCLGLLLSYSRTASIFGIGYFILDATIVGFLAFVEWEKIKTQA
jgi:hypothetical protein